MSESDQWWYRLLGEEFGPVPLDTVQELLQFGTLGEEDEIRCGPGGHWVMIADLAAEISGEVACDAKALLAADSTPPRRAPGERIVQGSQHSAAIRDAEREALLYLQGRHGGASKPSRRLASTRSFEGLLRALGAMGGLLLHIAAGIVVLAARAGRATRLLHPKVAATAGAALVAAGVIWGVATMWYSRAGTYASLSRNWNELRELRERGAGVSDWTAFAERNRAETEALVKKLERHVAADDRITVELLWAARDYWPQMLRDARESPSHAEERFELHLSRAGRMLDQSPPAGWSDDWVLATVLAIDVVLFVTGGVWFWRRRRHLSAVTADDALVI